MTRRCAYKTEIMEEYHDKEEGIILIPTYKHKPCRRLGRYGINGIYYCYDHAREREIQHLESIRR